MAVPPGSVTGGTTPPNGETFELAGLDDKVVLLAFWFPT